MTVQRCCWCMPHSMCEELNAWQKRQLMHDVELHEMMPRKLVMHTEMWAAKLHSWHSATTGLLLMATHASATTGCSFQRTDQGPHWTWLLLRVECFRNILKIKLFFEIDQLRILVKCAVCWYQILGCVLYIRLCDCRPLQNICKFGFIHSVEFVPMLCSI